MAIVTAATWAAYRFGLFRERIPRGVISHEVTHRQLTDSTMHVSVSVIFSNTGHVLWSFGPSEQNHTTIQQIKPITSDELALIEQQREAHQDFIFEWQWIDERPLTLGIRIEPSDTE